MELLLCDCQTFYIDKYKVTECDAVSVVKDDKKSHIVSSP